MAFQEARKHLFGQNNCSNLDITVLPTANQTL